MPLRIVQSKQNSRLKQLRRAFALPPRAGQGLVAIEGPNLLAEVLQTSLRVHSVFVAKEAEHLLDNLQLPPSTEILLLPAALLRPALATQMPQPIAALVEPPQWTWANLLRPHSQAAPLILVLAQLQDPGNLGAIIRSAEAFGASGIIALPGTVSAWNPKAVRASAGSVFRVPLLVPEADEAIDRPDRAPDRVLDRAPDRVLDRVLDGVLGRVLDRLQKAGVILLTTSARAARPATRLDLARPTAIIIGNEGSGVPHELAARADGAITVPCPGPVESLNAAVAASILLYEASRQRAAKDGLQ